MSFINTQVFREPAIHFKKYKRYADGDFLSYEWEEYWTKERHRIENGYTVGGVTITGLHYFYLNYLQIEINVTSGDDEFKQKLVKTKVKADRQPGFVDFWDEDYLLFWTWEIAKQGVQKVHIDNYNKTTLIDCTTHEERVKWLKYYSKHLTLPVVEDEYNLAGGLNHLWLKPRGRGASWKGAAKGIYNLYFRRTSKTFFVAHEEKYLNVDGIFNKVEYLKNYIQTNVSGIRSPFLAERFSSLEFITGYTEIEDGNAIDKGIMASVSGVTINGKPDNIRGKRGDIIYEEFGSFPQVKRTWGIAQRGVEQEGIVYGTQTGFGTGGDENAINIEDLSIMFNDPVTYNLLRFTNIYDEELYGLESAYFNSASASLSFKDKDGNSDRVLGQEYLDHVRKIAKEGSDPSAYTQICAELPEKPSEALLTAKGNIFPVQELQTWKTYVLAKKLHIDLVTVGRMDYDENGDVFFGKTDEEIYIDYPIKKGTVIDTPVHILQRPFKREGRVPRNLYRACLDPYRHDGSTGDSVGSFYIIENTNRLTPYKGDKIVAWYNARPLSQDEFSKQCYALAEWYNCKIGIENDETGDFIGYAKRHNKLHLLEEEFELAYDEDITTKKLGKRKFGMHIASGRENLRLLQGDKYIQTWLLRGRGTGEDGKLVKNLHTIYDVGFLEELIQYGRGKNYDRISSFRIGSFYEREVEYKGLEIANSVPKVIEQLEELSLY
jgi:hypothetical protein